MKPNKTKPCILFKSTINETESYENVNLGAIQAVPSQSILVKLYDSNLSIKVFKVALDSGATVSFLRLDVAQLLYLKIMPNGQLAILADHKSRMRSLGEIDVLLLENSTGHIVLRLRALIVKELGVECFGGQTLHLDNGIVGDVSSQTISFHNKRFSIKQSAPQVIPHPPPFMSIINDSHPPPFESTTKTRASFSNVSIIGNEQESDNLEVDPTFHSNPMSKTKTISQKHSKVLLPAGVYDIRMEEAPTNGSILIMPPPPIIPTTISDPELKPWPPQICSVIDGMAQYINSSDSSTLQHPRNVHFQAVPIVEITMAKAQSVNNTKKPVHSSREHPLIDVKQVLTDIKINRDILSKEQLHKFEEGIAINITAFDDNLDQGYVNKEDPYEATFSFKQENKAPPYKVWVPQFN